MTLPPSHDHRQDQADDWTTPTGLNISDDARVFSLSWADGHDSVMPWWYLRGMCPCAVCQGHGGDHAFVEGKTEVDLKDVNEVGHYALNLTWSDGHKTGIYSFTTLRNLCPCPACYQQQGERHAIERLPQELRALLSGYTPTAP